MLLKNDFKGPILHFDAINAIDHRYKCLENKMKPLEHIQDSRKEFDEAALRAQSIWERVEAYENNADYCIRNEGKKRYKFGNCRIESWKKNIANARDDFFHKRFEWDGCESGMIERILTMEPVPKLKRAMSWLPSFREIMGNGEDELRQRYKLQIKTDRVIVKDKPIPFEELYIPFIQYARGKVRWANEGQNTILSDNALISLERILLRRLSEVNLDIVYDSFERYVNIEKQNAIYMLFGNKIINGDQFNEKIRLKKGREEYNGGKWASRYVFDKYQEYLKEGGLYRLFQKYPVAARLSTLVTLQWIETTSEFVQRLKNDWKDISLLFNNGNLFNKVTSIEGNQGDTHEGGRSVLILVFDGDKKIVYKPRTIELEKRFAEILDWINKESGLLSLRVIKSINRETHGWIEYIQTSPCKSVADIKRFYYRCGLLLGLVYVMNGSDFHKENLIAEGENPVLIDLEAILGHDLTLNETEDADEDNILLWAQQKCVSSVLKTAMLPKYYYVDKRTVVNIGAMGGVSDNNSSIVKKKWKNINTDEMRLVWSKEKANQKNIPCIGSDYLPAYDWTCEIINGFRDIYIFLLKRRGELTKSNSILMQLGKCKGRFIFRNTSLYAKIIYNSCKSKYLQDGIDRSILFDSLSRALIHLEEKPQIWPILKSEREALENLDIPIFYTKGDSRDLYLQGGDVIDNCFQATAIDAIKKKMQSLSEEDLLFQENLIRGSFQAHHINNSAPSLLYIKKSLNQKGFDCALPNTPLQEAINIAAILMEKAYSKDDKVIWFGVNYDAFANHYSFGPINADLYNGLSGRAVFLNALAHETERDDISILAQKTIRTLLCYANEMDRAILLSRGLDNTAKLIPSLIYALCNIASYTKDEALLNKARKISYCIDDSIINRIDNNGLLDGKAGLILSLIRLYQLTFDLDILRLARKVVEILLSSINNRKTKKSKDIINELSENRVSHRNFAYGTTGMAFSLMSFNEVENHPLILNTVNRLLSQELEYIKLYREASENKNISEINWYNALIGSGFLMLKAVSQLNETRVKCELDAVITYLTQKRINNNDTLYTGNFGRLDFLLLAAIVLKRDCLLEFVNCEMAKVISAKPSYAYYKKNILQHPPLGLIGGLGGVGYQLLRIQNPYYHPSVLALDIVRDKKIPESVNLN